MYIDKAKLLEWLEEDNDPYFSREGFICQIESGAFDADEPDYKCPHCEKINSASSWNAATREVFGEDIGEIQDAAGDVFICPSCKSESDLRDISKV